MTDDARIESELLAAIRAAPEDDAPRLVYADWLIQRGDPRGEYIALACDAGYESYSASLQLWKQHEQTWLGVLPAALRDGEARCSVTMRHGFIEQIQYGGAVAAVLEPDVVTALLALAPVPDVWVWGEQAHLYFRLDGRVAARIQIVPTRARRGRQHVEIIELPSQRVIARASNVTETMDGHEEYTHGLAAHVRFAAERDALLYDLRDGETDHYTFRPCELVFERPASVV